MKPSIYSHSKRRAQEILTSYIEDIRQLEADPQMAECLKFIHEHLFDQRLNVNWLLRQQRLQAGSFSGVFRHHVGVYPKDYILNHRLEAGRLLLSDEALFDLPVQSIALMLGFGGKGAFGHSFRKECGFSPKKWRENKIPVKIP